MFAIAQYFVPIRTMTMLGFNSITFFSKITVFILAINSQITLIYRGYEKTILPKLYASFFS